MSDQIITPPGFRRKVNAQPFEVAQKMLTWAKNNSIPLSAFTGACLLLVANNMSDGIKKIEDAEERLAHLEEAIKVLKEKMKS